MLMACMCAANGGTVPPRRVSPHRRITWRCRASYTEVCWHRSSIAQSSQPAKSIAAAKTTSFIVSYKATAAGAQQAALTINSNDPDENPFTVNLTGAGQGSTSGDDHGNTIATATSVAVPSTKAGNISTGTDLDFFKFTLSAARSVTLRSTGTLDTYATLYNASGSVLDEADDISGTNYNFSMTQSLPAGTYYISVEGYSSSDLGAYSLVIQ